MGDVSDSAVAVVAVGLTDCGVGEAMISTSSAVGDALIGRAVEGWHAPNKSPQMVKRMRILFSFNLLFHCWEVTPCPLPWRPAKLKISQTHQGRGLKGEEMNRPEVKDLKNKQ
jgi:hypothetical protein